MYEQGFVILYLGSRRELEEKHTIISVPTYFCSDKQSVFLFLFFFQSPEKLLFLAAPKTNLGLERNGKLFQKVLAKLGEHSEEPTGVFDCLAK